jgi:hypothetical protein
MEFFLKPNQTFQDTLDGNMPNKVYIPYNAGRRTGGRGVNNAGDFKSHPGAQEVELASWINAKIGEGVLNFSATVNVDGSTIDGLGTVGNPYKVADDGIDTAQIAANAVTFPKMQDIATDRILGREAAGSGAIQELTLGAGLSLATGDLVVTSDGKELISDDEWQLWAVDANVSASRTGSDITITAATSSDLGRAVILLDSQTIQSNATFNGDVTITISVTDNSVNTWNATAITGWDLWIPSIHVYDAGTTTSVAGADLTDVSHSGSDAGSIDPDVSYGSGDLTLTFANATEFGNKARLVIVLSWLQ